MNCSLPGCSDLWILQARILEWVVISFSRGSSQPRDQTRVSCIFCFGKWIHYHWATREALIMQCSPSNKVFFKKETSKTSLEPYCLQPGSCHWVLKLKRDTVQWCADGGVGTDRIGGVLWEADRVCFKCNFKLQWVGAEACRAQAGSLCHSGLATSGVSGFFEQFHAGRDELVRIWSGRTRSAAALLECRLCTSFEIIPLTAQLYWPDVCAKCSTVGLLQDC